MKCPDCKEIITKEDVVDSEFVDLKGDGIGYDIPVYRCPKCGVEYNRDDLDS